MPRRKLLDLHRAYIESEGLDKLVDFQRNIGFTESVFDTVDGKLTIPLPAQPDDLVRLHKTIRSRKCFTVLEFGLGNSTIVMADALMKNQWDWEQLPQRPEIRNTHMFQLFSVDTSKDWMDHLKQKFPSHLADRVHFNHSGAEIGTHNGQLCHYYNELPDIIPDFIYLDGPNPRDVTGSIRGLSFQCIERTVMAADLLLMEPTFLPGTIIMVDGRTNNARFLERNFTRNYKVVCETESDLTTFELKEERLGKYNLLGSDFF